MTSLNLNEKKEVTIIQRSFWVALIGLVIAMTISISIYSRGVNGPFMMDDYWNIVNNESLRIDNLTKESLFTAAFSRQSGILMRPISMSSFALNYYFQGESSYGFKWTNIIIHIICGLLIFLLVYGCLIVNESSSKFLITKNQIATISLLTAALWLVHPLNVSTVLYIVQRMTQLSALFMLLGMVVYVYGRIYYNKHTRGLYLVWFGVLLCLVLSMLSKETGALLIPLIWLIEIVIFRLKTDSRLNDGSFKLTFGLFILVPIIIGILLIIQRPGSFFGYTGREYTMYERLLSQFRILSDYIWHIFLPDYQKMGLTHDAFEKSVGLIHPASTLLSIAFISCVLFIAIYLLRRHSIISFSILFFFIGHSLESTILPLELKFEHRNYLPMVGILLLIIYLSFWHLNGKLRVIFLVSLLIFTSSQTHSYVNDWSRIDRYYLSSYEKHPNSVRANLGLAAFYQLVLDNHGGNKEKLVEKIKFHYLKAYDLNQNLAGALIRLLSFSWRNGVKIEKVWLENLSSTFDSKQYKYYQKGEFKKLVECEIAQECKFGRDYMSSIFSKMLEMGYGKSTTYNRMARYYKFLGKNKLAYEYAKYATGNGKEDSRWYLLRAELAMLNQNISDATFAYKKASENDRFNVHKSKLIAFNEKWQK